MKIDSCVTTCDSDISTLEVMFPGILLLAYGISFGRVMSMSGLTPQRNTRTSETNTGPFPSDDNSDLELESDSSDDEDSTDDDAHADTPTSRQRTHCELEDDEDLVDQPVTKTNVCIWDHGVPKKVAMSIRDLRQEILSKVKAAEPRSTIHHLPLWTSVVAALIPTVRRLVVNSNQVAAICSAGAAAVKRAEWNDVTRYCRQLISALMHPSTPQQQGQTGSAVAMLVVVVGIVATFTLSRLFFEGMSMAEITYYKRLHYAKMFSSLTSARRSRRRGLPYFRLKNVTNIKAWLALRGGRGWLKRQTRQLAADAVVSMCFLLVLALVALLGFAVTTAPGSRKQPKQTLEQTTTDRTQLFSQLFPLHVMLYGVVSSWYLLRYMMLGARINQKYQNTSVLLTEQLNLHLRIVEAPHKKDKVC